MATPRLLVLATTLATFAACSSSGGGSTTTTPETGTTLMGQVFAPSGFAVPGTVTVTIAGAAGNRTVTTDASGAYSAAGLAPGSYTVTASFPPRSGYTVTPASPSVAIVAGPAQRQDFTLVSVVPSHGISGSVTNATGKTGKIYVNARSTSCGGCSPDAGTVADATGAFTIHGLSPGSYDVTARLDVQGHGVANAGDPTGFAGAVNVATGIVGILPIALSNPAPATPEVPTQLMIQPGAGGIFATWDTVTDGNGTETATAYELSHGTDVDASNGGVLAVSARDDGHAFLDVTSGTHYFKIRSKVGAAASAWSPVVGPVTAGAVPSDGTTAFTVSGTVSVSGGTGTGPLLVVLVDESNGVFRAQRFASPSGTSQAYSITGVPAGEYFVAAIYDANSNGVIDEGDLTNTGPGRTMPTYFTVSGANVSNRDVTLSAVKSVRETATEHVSTAAGAHAYGLQHNVNAGVRRVVSATIVYGPNIALPLTVGKTDWGEHMVWRWLDATAPVVGDTYKYNVTYDDGSTDLLVTSSVTALLSAFAENLGETTTGAYTRDVPLFTWSAPASPPATYFYNVGVTGGASWWYPDGPGLPSSTTSVAYNTDGRANPATLATGTTYTWSVSVRDAAGNSARKERSYTP